MTAGNRIAKEEARRILGECDVLCGLPPEERAALFEHVRFRKYAAGEAIFLMGSAGDAMMVVLSGLVRISVPSPCGKEVVLSITRPREVFGEIALLDGKERTADAKAMTACCLAVVERRVVLSFLERHPSVWLKIVEMLCSRLRNTDQHVADLALAALPVRLAKALLRLAGLKAASSTPQIRMSQREFGNICGTSRESINKCLRSWQRNGIIRMEDRLLTIANRMALEDLAEAAT